MTSARDPMTLVFARTRRNASSAPPPPPPTPAPAHSGLPLEPSDSADVVTPLPDDQRAALEPVIGGSLRDVRIHTGEFAAALTTRLSAEALTIGKDVFFGRGRFDPGSPRGRALLAHELVHVRQQSDQAQRVQRYGGDRDSAEVEAEVVERQVLAQAERPRGGGLSVGRYLRNYTTSDGRAIQPGDRARLDAISTAALRRCEQELGPLMAQNAEIPSLEIALTLDLSALTDDQAADTWARAMADAIRTQLG